MQKMWAWGFRPLGTPAPTAVTGRSFRHCHPCKASFKLKFVPFETVPFFNLPSGRIFKHSVCHILFLYCSLQYSLFIQGLVFSKTADFASALFSCICIAAKVNKSSCIPFIVLISFRLILPKSERSRKGCRSSATRTSSTEKRCFLIFKLVFFGNRWYIL